MTSLTPLAGRTVTLLLVRMSLFVCALVALPLGTEELSVSLAFLDHILYIYMYIIEPRQCDFQQCGILTSVEPDERACTAPF